MAQFNYEQYAAQQAARNTNTSNNGNSKARTEVHFVGEYLRNDGDVVVVRFPYTSMNDITFETTHVVSFPGSKYGKRVSCGGDNCPICEEGVKLDTRVFVKCLVYVADSSGKMIRYNAVWDRPSAFADIELKNLMTEYGDISKCLFKIKRNGTGTATRYTPSIVLPNNGIYNDATCPADFAEINAFNPAILLCKTIAQYQQAMAPAAEAQTAAQPAPTVAEVSVQNVSEVSEIPAATESYAPATPTTPAYQAPEQPVMQNQYVPPVAPQYQAPVAPNFVDSRPMSTATPTTPAVEPAAPVTPAPQPERQQRRYQF